MLCRLYYDFSTLHANFKHLKSLKKIKAFFSNFIQSVNMIQQNNRRSGAVCKSIHLACVRLGVRIPATEDLRRKNR